MLQTISRLMQLKKFQRCMTCKLMLLSVMSAFRQDKAYTLEMMSLRIFLPHRECTL